MAYGTVVTNKDYLITNDDSRRGYSIIYIMMILILMMILIFKVAYGRRYVVEMPYCWS